MKNCLRILTICIFSLFTISVFAQSELPLSGDILAFAPSEHDRVTLYDVNQDRYRDLEFGAGWYHVWDFSPDGCHVLFTKSDSPTSLARLYRVRLDGSELIELVDYSEYAPSDWGIWEPNWSPDGARIAFTMIRDDRSRDPVLREYHVGWIPPTGGEPTFYSVTGREHEPHWSPDGAWLVYMSYEERAPGADIFSTAVPTPNGAVSQVDPIMVREADLWLVSADAETKYPLTSFVTGSARAPRWSPDGDLIGFIYSPSPNNDTIWMISRQANSIPTQLSYDWGLALDLTWLRDSTGIISAIRDYNDYGENRLWQIPLQNRGDDTGANFFLESSGLVPQHADYPRFSSDGIWFVTRSAYALALYNIETGEARLLEEEALGNTPAVWSPEGYTGERNCFSG